MSKVDVNRQSEASISTDASGDRPPKLPGAVPKRVKTGGRKAGVLNRATRDLRAALKELAESHADDVARWLNAVAKKDPGEAFRLYLGLLRYCVPTLSAIGHADLSPKSAREQAAMLSDRQLHEIILLSPEAGKIIQSGTVKSLDDLVERLLTGEGSVPPDRYLPGPDLTDEDLK